MAHVQGATLVFEGEQIEPAYAAFSQWLSVDHDRKGGQFGHIIYGNGRVSSINLQAGDDVCNGPNRLASSWCSFTTGQTPQKISTRTYLTSQIRPNQS
jgi:hypothetical protein